MERGGREHPTRACVRMRVRVYATRNRFVKYEDFNQTDDREEERRSETVTMQ